METHTKTVSLTDLQQTILSNDLYNDTATINFAYNNGAQQVDFPADNPEQTHFSAFLVC